MRRITIVRLIFMLTFFTFFVVNLGYKNYKQGPKTLQEVLYSSHPEKIDIIHQEKVKDFTLVLYHQFSEKDLCFALVKKGFAGYNTVYSGMIGDADEVLRRQGFTYQSITESQGNYYPLNFGIISNADISKIQVSERYGEASNEARIVETEKSNLRAWVVDMSKFKEPQLDIVAFSADNKEISRLEEILR